jgi:DNA-binding beta-propeller fold protein YncE
VADPIRTVSANAGPEAEDLAATQTKHLGGCGSTECSDHGLLNHTVAYGVSEDGAFSAISCDSNKLIKSLPLSGAFAVTYDSIDNKAYCTFGDSLLVVDGATHSRIKSLPMAVATTPVWDPATDRLYVSCQTTNSIAVVHCVQVTQAELGTPAGILLLRLTHGTTTERTKVVLF